MTEPKIIDCIRMAQATRAQFEESKLRMRLKAQADEYHAVLEETKPKVIMRLERIILEGPNGAWVKSVQFCPLWLQWPRHWLSKESEPQTAFEQFAQMYYYREGLTMKLVYPPGDFPPVNVEFRWNSP